MQFLPDDIEPKWQKRWAEARLAEVDTAKTDAGAKLYMLNMFPYPSGDLHVGHGRNYILGDVVFRFFRMQGRAALNPMGWDAFGLPAENAAIKNRIHPREWTLANIERMKKQFARWGILYDWSRELASCDPEYYRWNQWLFLKLYEKGLAYRGTAPVNWCPNDLTVLANEQVNDGRCDRCGAIVEQRELSQWFFKITDYADRLDAGLDTLEHWPEKVKLMQRNWIGRSIGADLEFQVPALGRSIRVFTTRPDTIYGATFMVLAPEHQLVDRLVAGAWPEGTRSAWTGGHAAPAEAVAAYRATASRASDQDRLSEARPNTGVFTGGWATNPVNGQAIPVFVADYVLMGYGTGAIMAVPAQDERDWAFAEAYDLDIVRTVQPPEGWPGGAYVGEGVAINSSGPSVSLDGMGVAEAKAHITSWLEQEGHGRGAVTYKLRDWLFSRQRYWGEPFPIVYDEEGLPVALPESMLPVELPELDDFAPRSRPDDDTSEPEPPLGRNQEWVHVELDLGDGPKRYRRELNTMPQWAGSCWYYLRYLDPTNDERFVDREVEQYWMASGGKPGGVDLYVGGVEHAVLHLLYSRFWHKVLFDLGEVSTPEPFQRLFNQGMIGAAAYLDERGVHVPADEVVEGPDGTFLHNGRPVTRQMGKMGKSLKNSVTPDEIYEAYGADTLRVYEMSMGPLDMGRPWNTRDIVGAHRLLQRAWRAVVDEATGAVRVIDEPADAPTARVLARTIAGVAADYGALRFNTAVAKINELVNQVTKAGRCPRRVAEALALLLAPLAPHVAEELWSRLGCEPSVGRQPFPTPDPALLVDDTVTLVVQVNGKVRDRFEVATSITAEEAEAVALSSTKVLEVLAGGAPRKVVTRPPSLVNVVV